MEFSLLQPDAKIADPICTFLFAIVVLATTIPLLRDTGLVLLEGFPQSIAYNQVFSVLRDIPGVKHVHSLHVWSLTIGKHALSVHLAIGKCEILNIQKINILFF